jgi:hypothetical protein
LPKYHTKLANICAGNALKISFFFHLAGLQDQKATSNPRHQAIYPNHQEYKFTLTNNTNYPHYALTPYYSSESIIITLSLISG